MDKELLELLKYRFDREKETLEVSHALYAHDKYKDTNISLKYNFAMNNQDMNEGFSKKLSYTFNKIQKIDKLILVNCYPPLQKSYIYALLL